MAIPRTQVNNSELLNDIDRVFSSLSDCINLVETSLHKRKSSIKREKNSPQLGHTGDTFPVLIASMTKLLTVLN